MCIRDRVVLLAGFVLVFRLKELPLREDAAVGNALEDGDEGAEAGVGNTPVFAPEAI